MLINVLYFAAFCTIHAYASVFLLDRGFSNTQIGIALAAANIVSVIGQPFIAGIIDKSKRVTNRRVIMCSAAILLAGSLLLLFVKNMAAVFVIYVLIYTVQFIYQPVMIAMNFEYGKAGCRINFGLARGMGSAGFAVTSALIGGAVAASGTDVLCFVTIAVMVLQIVVTFFFKIPGKQDDVARAEESELSCSAEPSEKMPEEACEDTAAAKGFIGFCKRYPEFMFFLLGTACCFFAHNTLNDFLIQIIRRLGGNETSLGYATFLAALLELPVMACIGTVLKKFSMEKVLIFSSVAFFVKTFIMYFATGLFGMYASQACQFFAYAVFIPVSAIWSDSVMRENDKVKGQAYVNCAATLGGVFSNLLCGRILDTHGVPSMLLTACYVCLAGVVVTTLSMRRRKCKK